MRSPLLPIARLLSNVGITYLFGCSYVAPDTSACIADPAESVPDDRCGVFVSSSRGSDTSPGTRDLPVRTLAQAFTLAQAGTSRVYTCAETFVEAVEVPPGVELWGGLDCTHDWAYESGKKTTLAPQANAVPLRFLSGGAKSLVADVHAEAAEATQPGGSSIATIANPGAMVDIVRSELVAGDAGANVRGDTGGNELAMAGAPGADGAAACTTAVVPGAPAVETTCGEESSVGARGGDGGVTSGENGQNGLPVPPINPNDSGLGGTGATTGIGCNHGLSGGSGATGDHGLGATGPGILTLNGWEGLYGKDGGLGRPGQGGGGGGGSRGGSVLCGSLFKGGPSGGSGGAGGCGGQGGKGGGYGGASIGLLSLNADVTVRATLIVTGRGGHGGAGGLGQNGGPGGDQGLGGAGFNGSQPGCDGGPGGRGGNGGHGGGGLGGPSIGVAHASQKPKLDHVTIYVGPPGKGGAGDSAVPWGSGANGITADIAAFALATDKGLPSESEP